MPEPATPAPGAETEFAGHSGQAGVRHGPGGADPAPDGHRRAWWPRRRRPRRRLRDRRALQIVLAVLIVAAGWLAWSMGHALTAPGGGTFSERVAEWARDHYLGPVVTFGEWLTYEPPKVGGRPSFALTGPSAAAARPARHPVVPGGHTALLQFSAPRRLRSPAGRPLHGEGVWRVLATVHGEPAMFGTYLRPDAVHTSYVAGIVSMNQQLLRFQLRPGAEDPGPGAWRAQPWIPPGTRRGLVATFNGGFKIATSDGGFYLNGTYRGSLQRGVASVVYYRDGRMAIGAWGYGGLHMTSDVVGVRQNLHLIVSNGRVPASVDQNVEASWGATLGGAYYQWRSGIGITRGGRIIFVYGPALDVRTLAELLRRAGCVAALQLDINPDWMSFMYYLPRHHPGDPAPVDLLPNQIQPPDRYYALSNRDFTAVYAR